MGFIRDKDVIAVTVMIDVEGDKEQEIEDGWDALVPIIILISFNLLSEIPLVPSQG